MMPIEGVTVMGSPYGVSCEIGDGWTVCELGAREGDNELEIGAPGYGTQSITLTLGETYPEKGCACLFPYASRDVELTPQ